MCVCVCVCVCVYTLHIYICNAYIYMHCEMIIRIISNHQIHIYINKLFSCDKNFYDLLS